MSSDPARRYDAVLFDLDGTLLDSFGLIVESFHHTRQVHFGDRLPDAHYEQGIGTPLRDQLGAMARSAEEADAMVATYVEHNLAHHDEFVRSYEGAADVVRALSSAGVQVGIVTSKMRQGTAMGLRFLELADAFDVVVCADDVEQGKPHPEPVLRALKALNAEPRRTAFVGDSPHDVLSGNAAGVDTFAAEWGPFPRPALLAAEPTEFSASLRAFQATVARSA